MNQNEQELLDSLYVGFVDANAAVDSRFAPKLLTNDESAHTDVLSTLKVQLAQCSSFDFAVAFITETGIQTLIQLLLLLREKSVHGRIITTTFNNFNEPDALRKLLEFPNIEVRVYEGNMHTKGYFFTKDEINTLVIGSANLTQAALCLNKEWSVLLHSYEEGEILQVARQEYELLWDAAETVPLNSEWIIEYEAYRDALHEGAKAFRPNKPFVSYHEFSPDLQAGTKASIEFLSSDRGVRGQRIKPNAMQRSALSSLAKIHEEGAPRALLISATGTGKTYLSAFDILATKPSRVLFVAHRKRILEASLESFERVLGKTYSYGYVQGSTRDDANCLFAMVGTLANHLSDYKRDEFDYIVIDETHRAGAAGYRKILDYFKPGFVLGMTATPQRTDGYDIFELYNHVIAYRISLQDALREDMLAPFHYYGIADLAIDNEEQDDVALFRRLTSEERVNHIIAKLEDYSVAKRNRKGLVFCSRVDEASALSDEFNRRGYRTRSLSGADSDAARDQAIEDLEAGKLQYLFSVDIFNEGVDIPSVNQIIMLRPTESAIIFVQQLGRGLRKTEGKEAVLVLDFIGNYQNNYLIPIALSGDRTFDKDNLRRFVKEGSTVIPGCSTVSFDRISEARIFEKIDSVTFGSTALIRQEYTNLKLMLGRIPTLADFDENGMIDPLLIFEKFGSYHAFLSKYEREYQTVFTRSRVQMLKYVSQKLANGKRESELAVLKQLILEGEAAGTWLDSHLHGRTRQQAYDSISAMLTNRFTLYGQRKGFAHAVFTVCDGDGFKVSNEFSEALTDEYFRKELLEVIEFGLSRNQRTYAKLYSDTNFVLYEKYTLEDVCRLLNWEENAVPLNVGG